jgi:hypothetical protein
VWVPTLPGWCLLAVALGIPGVIWFFYGESWFSVTERISPDVLVVEGWIGRRGVTAAKSEFEQGGYSYVVTAGGLTNNRWGPQQWNYANEATELLVRLGIPAEKIITAPALDRDSQRTFRSALAVRESLDQRGLQPSGITVFTLGAHARRSRLVFAKVFPSRTAVGVVSWTPADYPPGAWWKSSERSLEFLKETVGWFYECLLNSGRLSNSHQPGPETSTLREPEGRDAI